MKFSPQAQTLLIRSLIFCCVFATSYNTAIFYPDPTWGYIAAADRVLIQDFSIIFNYAKDFWKGNNLIPYTESGVMAFMERWTGQAQTLAMPFAYSPTMLLFLLPFVWLQSAWAYFLWTIIPVTFLICNTKYNRELILLAAGIINFTTIASIILGQTVLWTMVAYLVILVWLLNSQKKQPFLKLCLMGIIAFLLTAKPPLAILIFALLFWARKWKVLAIALTLVLVEIIVMTHYLGFTWITDYIHLVARYNPDLASPFFASSLCPETMSNLSLVLHSWLNLSWSNSACFSNLFWLCGTSLTVCGGLIFYR